MSNFPKYFFSRKIYTFIFWIIITLAACQKDTLVNLKPNEQSTEIAIATKITDDTCLSIATYQNEIQYNAENDLLIVDVEYTPDNYVIHYATGESLPICKDSLFCWQFNPNWQVDFQFMDSSMTQAVFWADSFQVDIQTELNPSGYAPLTANLNLQSAINCSVAIEVVGQNGIYSNVYKAFETVDTIHQLPILGLYESLQNTINIICSSNGFTIAEINTAITTEAINVQLPEIYIDVNQVQEMEPGFQLVSYLQGSPNKPFMMDPYGDVRWFLDYSQHPQLNSLSYDVGIERLQNGNYYFGDIATSTIYEIDVLGNIINSWDLQGYGYHHNVYEKPNGNFLITCEVSGSEHLFGGFTNEDRIIEMDRTTGAILKEWDVRYILNETRTTFVDFENDWVKDWAHINAVIYDETDNTIIFSARHQSVVCKVDYNDNVQWILTPQIDLGENRQGQPLEDFVLTAVDDNNQAFNQQIQQGYQNNINFEWNWYQHAIKKIANNRFMVFDNGNNRNFGGGINYSRAVIYEINPLNMTVKQEWTYGRELGEEGYSVCCSDADYLPNSNHIVFSPGYNVFNNSGYGAKIIEVDYDTQEVVFQARLNSGGITLHRSERLSIYP